LKNSIMSKFESWMGPRVPEFVSDLQTLVRIPSVADRSSDIKPYGPECIKALEAALEMGEKYGFAVENYENYVGCIRFKDEDPARKTLGIWGHLDVVPAGTNWSFEPYGATYQDGFLIGRGVKDNKGPCVASLYFLRFLREAGVDIGYNVRLYLGCEEESGMTDLAYFTKNHTPPDLSIVPDSSFPICYAEKGIIEAVLAADRPFSDNVIDFNAGLVTNIVPDFATLTLKNTPEMAEQVKRLPGEFSVETGEHIVITVRGSARHTARPEGGINAAFLMADTVSSLEILSREDCALLKFQADVNRDVYGTGLKIDCEDEISGRLTCVGSVARVRDGRPTLLVNIRYPVHAKGEEIWESIASTCAQNGYTAEFLRDSKPNYFPLEDDVIQALLKKYREITGDMTEPSVMAGGTYARMLPRAFTFGMGGIDESSPPSFYKEGHGNAHEADEYLLIEGMIRAIAIYVECLPEIAGKF
jgi:succinyl-diaminopimelate desuccinylase